MRIIEIGPSKKFGGTWISFEAPGVEPAFEDKASALSYAKGRFGGIPGSTDFSFRAFAFGDVAVNEDEAAIWHRIPANLDNPAIGPCPFSAEFLVGVFEATVEFRLDVVGAEFATFGEDAEVVGIARTFGQERIEALAAALGGAVGCSRAVTIAGWRPHTDQVGQTGTKIAPEIYIPCGISGATQHMAGCKGAKRILAINTDPEAPIVSNADYAVIGDLHEVVPAITAAIAKARGG